jgi:sugar lactone lactonase YvrE
VDGSGATANFDTPYGVALDTTGNVNIAEWNRSVIRVISPAGQVSAIAGVRGMPGYVDGTGGTAQFNFPSGVAVDTSGYLYVADNASHLIRKISPAGVVSTFAGTVGVAGSANGTGTGAQFNNPSGVAVDTSGHVYVADYSNQLIRKINPAGVVSTLAGSGVSGSANGTGTGAQFNNPSGVALDTNGNLYVADKSNHQIRKITSAGVVSTLAGVGTANSGTADGTGASARFNSPTGVAVDKSGKVYVADYTNHLIRQISPEGLVSTLAGVASMAGYVDGVVGTAKFNNPSGVAVDTSGHVYVADSNNHRVRKITPI